MKNEIEGRLKRILNGTFIGDKELFDTAMKVDKIIRDFDDLVNDKYPGTTYEEEAAVGMQLFWDSCKILKMSKSDIEELGTNILKAM